MTTTHIGSLTDISETGIARLAEQQNHTENLEILTDENLQIEISVKESRELKVLAGIGVFSAYTGAIAGATAGYLSSENPLYSYPLAITGGIVGPAITTLVLIGGMHIKNNIARILKYTYR